MNRQEKAELIQEITNGLSASQAALLVGYKGLSVTKLQGLRKDLRAQGSSLKIAKARLMKRAVENVQPTESLIPHLHDQIGMVLVSKDLSGVLKVLHTFLEENEGLTLVAGCADSKFLDKNMLTRMATLPSKEVLLAQLCGVLKAPIAKFAFVLSQIKEKKQ